MTAALARQPVRKIRLAAAAIGLLGFPALASADAWPPVAPPALSSGTSTAPSLAETLRPAKSPVAEPSEDDPHYARMCDAFGEGFTYSPGTGTCIKIGGYVKFGTSVGVRN